MARPYQRRRWELNPLEAALQAAAVPSGSSAQSSNVLARSRTWSSTFARSRANPAHSEDVFLFSAPPRNRTSSGSFEDCHAIRHTRRASCRKCLDQELNLDLDLRRVLCDPLHHRDLQRPDLESNQDQGLRRAPCDPLHHRDRQTRADDWICTSIMRFTGPPPCCSATSASQGTSARSRTPCGRVGICLLSQEHARVLAPGLATGDRVLITLREMLLPHAEREEYDWRNNYSRSVTLQYASLMNFDQLSIRTSWSA